MKDLIIIGSGGLGRETAWTAERINSVSSQWNILGFIDDNLQIQGHIIDGYKVIGTTASVAKYTDAYYVCAIGSARIRRMLVEKIMSIAPVRFATLIDPSCVCSRERINVGEGCIICANTYITLDIEIGEHVYIGGNGTIGHDAKIGSFVTLYPGVNVSGSTHISDGCELGTGTQIIQGLSVGANTIVGAGSVIVRNLPPDCTAVGVPAKPIKTHTLKA